MLLNQAASANIITIVLYVVVFGAIIYFMMVRPQRKQQKESAAMHASMQAGDSVLTTSGFYGVIIDIMDNTVVTAVSRCRRMPSRQWRNQIFPKQKKNKKTDCRGSVHQKDELPRQFSFSQV